MFYKYFFIIVASTVFASCGFKGKDRIETNIDIQSESLRGAIQEYDSIIRRDPKLSAVLSDDNYLLTVYERNINDSVKKFAISFSLDTWLMQGEPVWLAQIDSKYVVFYPSESYRRILSTDRQFHKKIAHRYFPKEYMLLEKGKSLDNFTTIDYPSLVLTFCKGKLVTKKMSMGI